MNEPNSNADREILEQLQDLGSDLSRPMIIDYHFISDERSINRSYDHLVDKGFVCRSYKPGSHQRYHGMDRQTAAYWLLEVSVNLLPEIQEIQNLKASISEELASFGCREDGWASYGNCFSSRER